MALWADIAPINGLQHHLPMLLPELQRYKDTARCTDLGKEVPRPCQEHLLQTVIVCLLKNTLVSLDSKIKEGSPPCQLPGFVLPAKQILNCLTVLRKKTMDSLHFVYCPKHFCVPWWLPPKTWLTFLKWTSSDLIVSFLLKSHGAT